MCYHFLWPPSGSSGLEREPRRLMVGSMLCSRKKQTAHRWSHDLKQGQSGSSTDWTTDNGRKKLLCHRAAVLGKGNYGLLVPSFLSRVERQRLSVQHTRGNKGRDGERYQKLMTELSLRNILTWNWLHSYDFKLQILLKLNWVLVG